jgi:hypothetical protein
MERLGLALNTRINALTQYAGLTCNSLAVVGDRVVGATDQGLVTMEGTRDLGQPIPWFFELHRTDLGSPYQKRVAMATFGGEADGPVDVEIVMDQEVASSHRVVAQRSMRQGTFKLMGHRRAKGRYLQFIFKSRAGSRFKLDNLQVWTTTLPV